MSNLTGGLTWGGTGAAAIMEFSARPNAADVPEGYVIAGTEICGARFVAMTKNGITDW